MTMSFRYHGTEFKSNFWREFIQNLRAILTKINLCTGTPSVSKK